MSALLIAKSTVDSAFSVGETPVRMVAKIYNDKVCAELPAQKNERRKSSSEMINTKSPAVSNVGIKIGTITFLNV